MEEIQNDTELDLLWEPLPANGNNFLTVPQTTTT